MQTKPDLIIRKATVIDGTGVDRYVADLAISDDRITAIGNLDQEKGANEVNASGKVIAPGFIDAHCHDDLAVLDMPLLEPKVSQGVTTVINGNCGVSIAPVVLNRPEPLPPITLLVVPGARTFSCFKDYFSALDNEPPAVNSAILCGHATLRQAAMDDVTQPATSKEVSEMCALLDTAMRDGALGMSTGLYYPGASAAPTDEVVAIGQCLAEHSGLYVTHMRDEADDIEDSLHETFQIGRETGVPVIVSHHKCVGTRNHGRSVATLGLIEAARKNQEVGLDVYPYVASSTVLQPERVASSAKVLITWSDPMPSAAGRDLDDIARELNCSAIDAANQLMPGGAVYFAMDETDVRRILSYEHTMIGSDGIVTDKHPHPRAWGTFPRVLGHYARDEQLFSLEEAVRKMTSLPATRFDLQDRGVLREGAFADLVLFDEASVIDTATFENPSQAAAGIEKVYTNGRCVWSDGCSTGARPGRALRAVT